MFEKLIGNAHIKEVAERFVRGGRVPNSLLFAGDEGVGKRQFALELARTLVCTDPQDLGACGRCSACVRAGQFTFPNSEKGDDFDRVFSSGHPDVGMVIPFRRNVRIGAIRHLEKEANYSPFEARARVFIIDDAEKMADPAANALLKTLEEPPASTYIFLISSRPDSLLPTIRSRCQLLRFAPVPTHEIERYLIDSRQFITEEATLAARLARGSIGRAVSINVEQFRQRRQMLLEVVTAAVSAGGLASMLRVSEDLNTAKNKENFEENLDILESLIHDIWTLHVSKNNSRVVNSDLTLILSNLALEATHSNFPEWLADIEKLRGDLAVNVNRKVATDALFVAMAGI